MPSVSGLNYFHRGAGKSPAGEPPVILIHGAGGSHLTWPPQIRRLSARCMFAPDLPGHGRSSGQGRQSIEAYAEDLTAFMGGLSLDRAVLMGVSMGSGIALEFALRHPQRTAGLVLMGGGARLRVSPAILAGLGSPDTYAATLEKINDYCFSEGAPARLKDLSKRTLMQVHSAVLQGDFLACDRFDVSGRLDRLEVPTRILCGSEDRMTPVRCSEGLRDSIRGASLQVVEGAGHMAMAEQPQAVATLVQDFLESLPSRPRG